MRLYAGNEDARRRRVLAGHLRVIDAPPQAQDCLLDLKMATLKGMVGFVTRIGSEASGCIV